MSEDKTNCFCCKKDVDDSTVKDEEGNPYCSEKCKKHVESGHPETPGICEFC